MSSFHILRLFILLFVFLPSPHDFVCVCVFEKRERHTPSCNQQGHLPYSLWYIKLSLSGVSVCVGGVANKSTPRPSGALVNLGCLRTHALRFQLWNYSKTNGNSGSITVVIKVCGSFLTFMVIYSARLRYSKKLRLMTGDPCRVCMIKTGGPNLCVMFHQLRQVTK